MVFQPRNIQPSFTSIDGTTNNTVTMEVNTNRSVTAYDMRIIDFDNIEKVGYWGPYTPSAPLYNGDTLSIPIPSSIGLVNGKNYKFTARLYQSDSLIFNPETNMFITTGTVQATSTSSHVFITPNINIKPDMKLACAFHPAGWIYCPIISHDIITGETILGKAYGKINPGFDPFVPSIGDIYNVYSEFIETIPENILYVRATPTVTISTFPAASTLDKKYFDFVGTYTQANGVPMQYYLWNLYLINVDGTSDLIDTSGKVYRADLKYSYDGFKSGNTYKIELLVENEFGITATSGLQSFVVSYTIIDYFQKPVATLLDDKDAIEVNWTTPTTFAPVSGVNTLTKLYDNPYINTNSVLIQTNDLVYNNGTENIGDMPTTSRITAQFNPTPQFFYDYMNIFNSLIPLFEVTTDELDNAGNINVLIHKNKLVAITPLLDGGATKIEAVVSGSTSTQVKLATDTTATQLYITFPEHDYYTERIASYDSGTNVATMDKELPFTPATGEDYYLNETIEAIFYTPNTASLSSATPNKDITVDYIWDDNITWNDLYYWVEGGTEIERIAQSWWKAEIIIGDSVTLMRGGI